MGRKHCCRYSICNQDLSPTILKKVLSLVLQIFLYLQAFECNTTSDWLNGMVKPIRSCVTSLQNKKKMVFLRFFVNMDLGHHAPPTPTILNPLPDDKILEWSKLKQIADDILKCI